MCPTWKGRETYCFLPLHQSVCPSQNCVCPLHNLKTVRYYNETCKAHLHDMSCTRTITLLLEIFPFDHLRCYFVSLYNLISLRTRTITFQIIPLVTLLNPIFCLLCKLNTVKAIWLKLHALLEHNETMCHVQDP